MLESIGQIAITVRDVAAATAFYRDSLGLPFLFSAGNMSFFDCGGTRLMISIPEGIPLANSVLYFRVRQIDAAHETLLGRGVVFDQPPHLIAKLPHADLWMAFFRDNENNLLALMSEVSAN